MAVITANLLIIQQICVLMNALQIQIYMVNIQLIHVYLLANLDFIHIQYKDYVYLDVFRHTMLILQVVYAY